VAAEAEHVCPAAQLQVRAGRWAGRGVALRVGGGDLLGGARRAGPVPGATGAAQIGAQCPERLGRGSRGRPRPGEAGGWGGVGAVVAESPAGVDETFGVGAVRVGVQGDGAVPASLPVTDESAPYLRIAADLRAAITCGALKVGAALPTIAELGSRYDVAASTAERAIGMLAATGEVTVSRGRRAIVP
jgi:hypothetical protein